MNKRPKNKYFVIADSVGIAHFAVANLCVVLGQVTDIFKDVGGKYPGLTFVYRYFDAPFVALFGKIASERSDPVMSFLMGEFIIVGSSIIYGIFAYIFLRIVFAIFNQ